MDALKYELIINHIIDGITNGTYQDGMKIPTEKELTEEFGMGRGSVREALKILQYIGVITGNQGSGYRVNGNMDDSFSRLMELFLNVNHFTYKNISEMREALEIKCLLLIQQHGCMDDDIQFLKNCVESMKDRNNAVQADIDFHQRLVELSRNPLLIQITKAFSKIRKEYIRIPWDKINEDEMNSLLKAHYDIIESLTSNKNILCENGVSQHYQLADKIIYKSNFLYSDASSHTSLAELVNSGLTNKEINEIIDKIREGTK